ncbi:glutathione S-transferase family protein [Kushneria phosphatilytica]|uniref:Glutathione S-transferase n=1 Tax=Kushneria phosphatilytica TaxID=657387 RepID=A0A1S1NZW0_9GAMM|nr:glutathione S-transferase [Kushneria phosphatilytica]OHV13901.1 glutathione S-transferase [Kushneria phosphatilytica]QEL10462.1 glutathione S-transferase [Kushneria phosphatilytica]
MSNVDTLSTAQPSALTEAPVKLYRNPKSGHCHRVELMLALLGVPYENIDLDMANGAHREPAYLKISPLGQVPAIDDNGITLADSNAIITYLVERYGEPALWIGGDPLEKARVQRWLSIAAGEIAHGPCAARLVTVFNAPLDHEAAKASSHTLLAMMEAHLDGRKWLVSDHPTLADIAGYSYIAHAPEGGVSLDPYPQVRAWLSRIEALPHFVGMARSPVLA